MRHSLCLQAHRSTVVVPPSPLLQKARLIGAGQLGAGSRVSCATALHGDSELGVRPSPRAERGRAQTHGDMLWCKQASLGAGPDATGHLVSLQDWPAHKLVSTCHPVPPSRLSMWACLMGQAFKLTPQARLLWQSKEGVSVDTFQRHASKLEERTGVVPHVKQVWDSIVAESAREA